MSTTPSDQGSDVFRLEAIIAERTGGGRQEYLAKWAEYPVEEATWEPARNFGQADLAVWQLEKKRLQALDDELDQESDDEPEQTDHHDDDAARSMGEIEHEPGQKAVEEMAVDGRDRQAEHPEEAEADEEVVDDDEEEDEEVEVPDGQEPVMDFVFPSNRHMVDGDWFPKLITGENADGRYRVTWKQHPVTGRQPKPGWIRPWRCSDKLIKEWKELMGAVIDADLAGKRDDWERRYVIHIDDDVMLIKPRG